MSKIIPFGPQPPKPINDPDYNELQQRAREFVELLRGEHTQAQRDDAEYLIAHAAMRALYGKKFWEWADEQG